MTAKSVQLTLSASSRARRWSPRLCSTFALVLTALVGGSAGQAQSAGTVLKGRAVEHGYAQPGKAHGGPTLTRGDIDRLGDPFGGGSQPDPDLTQMIEAPPAAPPSRGFGLGTKVDDFAGKPPPRLPPKKADAEDTGVIKIAWDAWHKRVGTIIYQRWSFLSNAAFQMSPPLNCRISYVVTRDGIIEDVKVLAESPDEMYNALVVQAVQSISGDKALLQFPPGSRRVSVEKVADFCQNCDLTNTVRYATGDKETVSPK